MAKALCSTTISVSCAHQRQRHHDHHHSRRSPLSLSTFGSTFPSFVFGCFGDWIQFGTWKTWQFGSSLKFGHLGGGFCRFDKKKKLKKYKLRKCLVKERKMKELKRVFRSYCKMPNFLCFTNTLSATLKHSHLDLQMPYVSMFSLENTSLLQCFFVFSTPKKQLYFIIKKINLNGWYICIYIYVCVCVCVCIF